MKKENPNVGPAALYGDGGKGFNKRIIWFYKSWLDQIEI